MKKTSTFSTPKIIALVAFICAAIFSSVFIYHLRFKPAPVNLSTDERTLFPQAREIKSFELNTANNQKFTQKDFYGHWTLLFFGFTHCDNVCPTTLDMMNRAYSQLKTDIPNLQVILVSLDPDRDNAKTLAEYTRSFNPEFIGITGKIPELHRLQSQLGIYSARDAAKSENNYQIQHTSSIMLINPQGKWAGLFKFGMKPDQFKTVVLDSVKTLS